MLNDAVARVSALALHVRIGLESGRHKQFCRFGFKTRAEALDHFVQAATAHYAKRAADTIVWRSPLQVQYRDNGQGWGYYAWVGFGRGKPS